MAASTYSFGRRNDDPARLLATLAARIEGQAERIATEVISGLVDERSAPAGTAPELASDTRAFVGAVAASLRSGARHADPSLREQWRAAGRRAADAVALPALIGQLEAEARVVIGHLVAEWSALPAEARSVEAHLMSTTLELATDRVASVAEAYLDACLQRQSGRREAAGQFLAEAVDRGEGPPPSPGAVGLATAPSYVVVAVLLADGDWSMGPESRQRLALRVESSPTIRAAGALWAEVDQLGVLVLPSTQDRSGSYEAVEAICALADDDVPDFRLRVAVTEPNPGLDGIRLGFEHARRTLEVAARLSLSGVVHPGDVLVPALLVSAPDIAVDLAGLVVPVGRRASTDLLATLRELLAAGLSIAATARVLGVHPGTVRARLVRIERLLELRVADEVDVLALALLAYDMGFAPPGPGVLP